MTEKIVIIGGAGGIGQATVSLYYNRELEVIIGDINEGAAVNVAKRYPERVTYNYLDIRDPASIQDFVEIIGQNHRSIAHCVNVAGWALPGEFDSPKGNDALQGSSLRVLEDSVRLNLLSPMWLAKEFLPLLGRDSNQNRTFTNITSINAIRGYGLPGYSAAKAGFQGFMVAVAEEFASQGIRINAIMLGTTNTPIINRLDQKTRDAYKEGTLLGRITEPDEVAKTVYAVTHLMTSMTGQTVIVDAGQSIKAYQARLR